MRKRFKAKKKKNKKIFKILVFVVLIFVIFQFVTNYLLKLDMASSNEEFIKKILNDSNHHMTYEKYNNNLSNKFIKLLSNIDLKKPTTILKKTFGYDIDSKVIKKDVVVASDVYDEKDKLDVMTNYIEDPNPTQIDNPRIYIYNTHQLENYSATNFEDYNITPNVLMASYLLKEKLNKKGIPTIVETSNIKDFLNLNGWDYSSSYKASRFYVLDAINKYNNLDMLIDLHRDSVNKDKSTTTILNKKYAKVLFVVGLDHQNYQPNLDLANKINEMIKEKYPTLSRGVVTKKGEGVNGIYNQDLSTKSILIECGGNENSIDEVMNTIDILTSIIKEYLGENNEN